MQSLSQLAIAEARRNGQLYIDSRTHLEMAYGTPIIDSLVDLFREVRGCNSPLTADVVLALQAVEDAYAVQ